MSQFRQSTKWTNCRPSNSIILKPTDDTDDNDVKFQHLINAKSITRDSIGKPFKINQSEILFIMQNLGIDSVSKLCEFESITMIKYNVNNNQWQERRIILNENVDPSKIECIDIYNVYDPPKMHDVVYDMNRNNLYMIDNTGKLWIIVYRNDTDDYRIETRILSSNYGEDDWNDPKLIIANDNLYLFAPDCHDGRYVIDLSLELNTPYSAIKHLGLFVNH